MSGVPFDFTDPDARDLEALADHLAVTWYDAIQYAASNTARTKQQYEERRIGVSNLGHCFSGDTEVPTRRGIYRIDELVGGAAELLIPSASGSGVSSRASWQTVNIDDFGVQPLRKITLSRPGSTREVYATAGHEWFVTRSRRNRDYVLVRTDDLCPGDRMKEAWAGNPKVTEVIPAAAVMGFIHGDGSVDHSGSEVRIAHNGNKSDSEIATLVDSFARTVTTDGIGDRFRGLPRSWKSIPDFSEETPAFALSWLAGYFAADGSVDAHGGCLIQSSSRESIEAVRYAATLAGVLTNPIRSRAVRGGFGLRADEEREIFSISLRRRTVPDWFFLNAYHARRAKVHDASNERESSWTVRSVEETDRVEPVYCAVVPGTEAFVLTEGLVTHNCREYARRLITGEPFTDERDKTPAWFGTTMGDAIETALAELHPDWLFQAEVTFKLPSGGEMNGHPDVIIPSTAATEEFPQGIYDNKGKDGLENVRKYGQTQQQKFQLVSYAKAAIDAGLLDPDKPIYLGDIFYDRTGRDIKPYVVVEEYSPAVVDQIDDWVGDVKYAVIHGEEAARDMPRDFCMNWCEFATGCRGLDTDVTGLLEDPEVVAAAATYREALNMESQAKAMKLRASRQLKELAPDGGNTPDFLIRHTWVNGGHVEFDRAGYWKTEVKPLAAAKKGKERTT